MVEAVGAEVNVGVGREAGAELAGTVGELLRLEPDLPYANFEPLRRRPEALAALHGGRWSDPAALAVLVARGKGGEPLAALRLEHRSFESAHFDRAMAKIERPLATADHGLREVALRALLPDAFDLLAERGYEHVALRASTRDRVTPWVAQELGAFHVDTQVSWMADLDGVSRRGDLPPGVRIEIHERPTLAALPPSAWARLAAWAADGFDRGPLLFDLGLPRPPASRIYQAWTEKVMSGEWADAVLVARHGDEVVAFISMLDMPDVSEAAGVKVCGRGLGATLPEYHGLFTAIQREMIAARPLGARYMENETQASTVGSINVYAKLGFRYLRSTSTFHLRLPRGRPR